MALKHVKPSMRQAGVKLEQVWLDGKRGTSGRRQFTISKKSRTQDPMPTITPVAIPIPERFLVCNQLTKSSRSVLRAELQFCLNRTIISRNSIGTTTLSGRLIPSFFLLACSKTPPSICVSSQRIGEMTSIR